MAMGGGLWTLQRMDLALHGISTTGRMTGFYESTTVGKFARTITTYSPRVEFTAADGRVVSFRGGAGYPNAPHEAVGQEFKVLYPADNPQKAAIVGFKPFWLGPLAFCFSGLVMCCAGVASFILMRKFE